MLRRVTNRGAIVRVVSVLSVLLVLAMGTAQAIHSHPSNTSAHHSCSICATPNLSLPATAFSVPPVLRAVRLEGLAPAVSHSYRLPSAIFIRPPPAC